MLEVRIYNLKDWTSPILCYLFSAFCLLYYAFYLLYSVFYILTSGF